MTKIGYKAIVKASTDKTVATSTAATVTAIGRLIQVGEGPTGTRAKVPTLVIDSTVFECGPGLPDDVSAMPLTIEYKQGDAGVNKLIKMFDQGIVGKFFVCYNSTTMTDDSFKGFVQSLGRGVLAGNQQMTRTVSVQPTSAVSWST